MRHRARAFAARLFDGSVITWGNPACGGDSAAVRDELKRVQDLKATAGAFAARRADGSVVTWGNGWCGGDSERVRLKDVEQLSATKYAFAALMTGGPAAIRFVHVVSGGTVVSWGAENYTLSDVVQLESSLSCFAATLADGSAPSRNLQLRSCK